MTIHRDMFGPLVTGVMVLFVAVSLLVLGACGDDDDDTTTYPVQGSGIVSGYDTKIVQVPNSVGQVCEILVLDGYQTLAAVNLGCK